MVQACFLHFLCVFPRLSYLFTFLLIYFDSRALFLIQMGVPTKPKASRI
jgi:hypothetical protein